MSAPINIITTLPFILFTLLLDLPSSLPLALPYPPSTTSNLPVTPSVLRVGPEARINDTVPAPSSSSASIESASPVDFSPPIDSGGLQLEITVTEESLYLPLTPSLTLVKLFAEYIANRPSEDFGTVANYLYTDLEIVLEPTPGAAKKLPKLLMVQFMYALHGVFELNEVAYPCKLRIIQEDGGGEFVRGNLTQVGGWKGPDGPTVP